MSDLDLTNRTNFAQGQKMGSSQTLKDQIRETGAEVKERAGAAIQASTDIARDKVSEATRAAKGVASDTMDQIEGRARQQQQSGADFMGRLADDFREAARAFERDVPFAARGISSAANYVEDAADKMRNGSLRGFVEEATDFAKRQPAAFLGITVLAGFVAVRFLRASGEQSSSQ
jgi:hypothetical protein